MKELATGPEPGPGEWDPWEPEEVAERLQDIAVPWCIAGGWSIDVFLGRRTREHSDIEIVVPDTALGQVTNTLAGHEFFACDYHTFARAPGGKVRLDVMRDPHDGDTWIWRVNNAIRRPYAELVQHTDDGIPYQAPEVSLLYKAGVLRPKDDADLDAAVGSLSVQQRAWMRAAIAETWGEDHRWLTGGRI